MAAPNGLHSFPHGHKDLVLAVDYNLYGDRLVTASSDHFLKVWDKSSSGWELCESWRAHDAEIVDVKWNGPFTGQTIGSISEDGTFKLWSEDSTIPRQSSRRFKAILHTPFRTKSRFPWMSLDFKNLGTETYLALISRDGNFVVMEPKDHDYLAGEWVDWMGDRDWFVGTAPPDLGDEASFRVSWHKEKLPCFSAVQAGLDRRSLSIAVAAMDVVKVFRTDRERRLYLAAEVKPGKGLLRDVAWANGSMRGFDVIAAACKDGMVRVFEVRTSNAGAAQPETKEKGRALSRVGTHNSTSSWRGGKAPSGIGAGLAGTGAAQDPTDLVDPSRVQQTISQVAELSGHKGSVWRVTFSYAGDLLLSTGDDGSIRSWKRAFNNEWLEYSEIDVKSS